MKSTFQTAVVARHMGAGEVFYGALDIFVTYN